MAGLDAPQLVFFVILAVAFVLLLTERLRNDVVAILIVLALAVSGLRKPEKAFSGFGSEPAYGPGGYRFGDFVRVGAPLTLICAAIVVLLAPMLWRG